METKSELLWVLTQQHMAALSQMAGVDDFVPACCTQNCVEHLSFKLNVTFKAAL